ncbi:hypothetical protein BANRA_05375 [Klebsiella pneumoniae]|nr:hypothetical protein BANRA_05375 [Klebsiella pneumoniae]
MMYGEEKSDSLIVAAKQANNPKGAESVERRSGAKGNAEQPHMRRTQSRESMSQRLSRVRGSCEAAEERTVYSIVPPADSRSTGSRIPLPEQESGRRSGWHQVDGLRRKHEEQHNRSAPEATSGQLQGAARQASLHPKSGWKTTPARHRLAGGQDRPVCAGENPERSLKTTLWGSHTGSDRAKPARCTGRTGHRAGTH